MRIRYIRRIPIGGASGKVESLPAIGDTVQVNIATPVSPPYLAGQSPALQLTGPTSSRGPVGTVLFVAKSLGDAIGPEIVDERVRSGLNDRHQ